jgi:hypothetical protein
MITDHVGHYRSARCSATTDVTVTELEKLAALPDPVDPARLHLICDLAAGHQDSHVAFVVAAHAGDQLWWLRWAERLRDVVQMELCETDESDSQDVWLLPHGHRGPHSFEIQPS